MLNEQPKKLSKATLLLSGVLATVSCEESCEGTNDTPVQPEKLEFTGQNDLACGEDGERVPASELSAYLYMPNALEPNEKPPVDEPAIDPAQLTQENGYHRLDIQDGEGRGLAGNWVQTLVVSNSNDLPSDFYTREDTELIIFYGVQIGEYRMNCARTLDLNSNPLDFEWQSMMSQVTDQGGPQVSFIAGLADNEWCIQECVPTGNESNDDSSNDETDTNGETETTGMPETETSGMPPVDMPEGPCQLDANCEDELVCDGNGDCIEGDIRYAYTLSEQPDNPEEEPWAPDWTGEVSNEEKVLDLTTAQIWRDGQLVTLASAANGQGDGIEYVAEEDCDGEAIILEGQSQEDGPAQFDRIELDPNAVQGQLEQCHVTVDVTLEHNGKVVTYPSKEVTITVNTAQGDKSEPEVNANQTQDEPVEPTLNLGAMKG